MLGYDELDMDPNGSYLSLLLRVKPLTRPAEVRELNNRREASIVRSVQWNGCRQ
jgi:hypothetical protein